LIPVSNNDVDTPNLSIDTGVACKKTYGKMSNMDPFK
jgi:hypothetical protein